MIRKFVITFAYTGMSSLSNSFRAIKKKKKKKNAKILFYRRGGSFPHFSLLAIDLA